MVSAPATLYFDFVDPLSYLLELELGALEASGVTAPERRAFELRPPPTPLVLVDDEALADRWSLAGEIAPELGVDFAPPRLVPWSRKAHELHLLAAAHDLEAVVRRSIFEAYLLRGLDIGRVDVLVDLGRAAGLDRTDTKAVLDVDRHEADVATARAEAERLGVETAPLLVRESVRLQGFHNRTTLGTFLRDFPGGGDG
jgi:predicted DsbA family dithiol-disulfide isomerase